MRESLVPILCLATLLGCASAPEEISASAGRPSIRLSPRGAGERPSELAPDLAGWLELALEQNPRIRAARERAEAAAETPAIEGWLPDPELLVGWYQTPVQTRVGPQEWSLGVRQKVPFPTKLSTRARMGEAEARRAIAAYERAVRDVLTEVVKTAWELAYLDEAAAISAEIGPLVERYVAATAGGEALLSEHFRAETQRAQLENDRVVLRELRAAEGARLHSLLALPPGTPIATPAGLRTPAVEAGFEELLSAALGANQELAEADLAVEAAELRTSLAEQERLPDLTLGATRIFTGRLDSSVGDPHGSGRDAVVLGAGVTVPLWYPRNAASVRRARRLERAAEEEARDAAERLRERLARAYYVVGNAERLSRLYADVLVPRAALAARTAEDLLASGRGSVAGALETIAVLHDFRLAEARARADRGRAIADLEALVGRPFEQVRREGG